jgi:hypothetical protein
VSDTRGVTAEPLASPRTATVAGAGRRGNSRGARLALLAFILSPLVVVAILCVLIAKSLQSGPVMQEPPRGAGAGQTGMFNQHMGGPR